MTSSSFKFPPPPPPPRKAPPDEPQLSFPSQRGGFDRGRGDRNNDRGGRGRGRGGNNNFGGHSRGGRGQDARGHSQSRGVGRGGHGKSRGPEIHHGVSAHGQHRGPQANPSNAPYALSGAFPNMPYTSMPQPHVDPNTLAMSFMATPAGQQAMAAFATHAASTGALSFAPARQSPPSASAQSPPRYSPLQNAGQKRKWEDRSQHGRPQSPAHAHNKAQQHSSKPPRAKAAVAPPIPSFGFSLPTLPRPSTKAPRSNTKGKVRLGLTNQPPTEESSEDESCDEEAELGAKIKGGGFAFEHEGQQIALQTGADVAAWIKDRRRNFPTQQKIIEKAEAAATKRMHELEFMRKLKGKPPRPDPAETIQPKPKPVFQERSKKDDKKQEELAALRKKLHESMIKKRDAPVAVDLGLGYGSETESDQESSVLSESSVVSSSEESDKESDEEDSDAAPEPVSSKVAPPAIRVPPPPAAPQIDARTGQAGPCWAFKQYGKCSRGKYCRFKHSLEEEKRPSLFEKLVEQELVKADQLALEAIKYLGQNGYLG